MNIQSPTILQQADRCVKCGLCLPHCPTYGIAKDENESPRGRIALIQGLLSGQLSLETNAQQHLDRCTLCRRCERACPSGVTYGRLFDQAQQWLAQQQPGHGKLARFGRSMLSRPVWLRNIVKALWFYQRSGLAFILKSTGLLRLLRLQHFAALLPQLSWPRPLHDQYPAKEQQKGHVALFTGCLGPTFDQTTLLASIKLLTHLGYTVSIPSAQTCCGGLQLHAGDVEGSCELAQQNIHALADYDYVVYLASGCGASLESYRHLAWPDESMKDAAHAFCQRVTEVTHFVSSHTLESLSLQPRPGRVVVHTPCSARTAEPVNRLLAHIPDMAIDYLANSGCCGAAGTYMLSQPQLASQLRATQLTGYAPRSGDTFVTTNLGCALHIKDGLPKDAKILHPIALLAEQLSD